MSITIKAPARNFLIISPAQERGDTVTYEKPGEQILWDDGADILWDEGSQIVWSADTTGDPILIHAKRRNFTIFSPER